MEAKSYKDTVNLPKTKFDMRANAVKREPELQQFWADQEIYDRLSHDNPPRRPALRQRTTPHRPRPQQNS